MKKIALYLLPLTICLLASCEKVIDIDPSDSKQKVVVIATVEADSTVTMRVTLSRFFLDQRPFTAVRDASAVLNANGTDYIGTGDSGNYRFAYVPQPGDQMSLSVTVPGHGTVTAKTVVPTAPNISNLRFSTNSDSTINIHFTLNDDGAEDNFYGIRVYSNETFVVWHYNYTPRYGDTLIIDTMTQAYTREFYCNDPLLSNAFDLEYVLDGEMPPTEWLVFTDEHIDGTSHEVTLNTTDYYPYTGYNPYMGNNYGDYGGYAYVDSVKTLAKNYSLEVVAYSRDRYLFEISENAYDDDPLLSFIAEPVRIHSNIDGGIGIFAAATKKLITLQ